MLVILAVLIFFMFRNSRKRKQQVEELQSKMVPGAEVMTNFGLFGTLKSVDEVTNQAELEIAPGTTIKVHRQTLAKVVDDVAEGEPRSVEEAMAIAEREQAEREAAEAAAVVDTPVAEPEFGERAEVKKPARRTPKKTAE
jgi:preprotein translocase subunit YajC